LALGCYDHLAQKSLSCPDDISVVGFNDIQFMDKVKPGLTTISLPQYEIGATAATLLLQRIREPHLPVRTVVLPVTLVVRGSTAPPPRRSAGRPRGASTQRRRAAE
jgi:LacI family transcriptional regulator